MPSGGHSNSCCGTNWTADTLCAPRRPEAIELARSEATVDGATSARHAPDGPMLAQPPSREAMLKLLVVGLWAHKGPSGAVRRYSSHDGGPGRGTPQIPQCGPK